MMAVLISIFYAAAAFFEIAPLKKAGEKKKIALFAAAWLAAYALSLLIAFEADLPSLEKALMNMFLTGAQQ